MGKRNIMLYLDNAATSYIKPKSFYREMNKCTRHLSVNSGRGGHKYSVLGAKGIMETSEKLSLLFNIDNPEDIAYSYNATMSLNQAIGGVLSKGGHAIVTQMEHNSVLRPINKLGNYTVVSADNKGRIAPQDIKNAIREDTKLIVCTHASNVSGTVEPIEEIGKIARKNNILFLVDGAQTAGGKKIDVKKMNIDMLAFSAHKGLLGPLGVGGLYVRDGVRIEPIISGGTGSMSKFLEQPEYMPDLLQAGTMNTPAIVALGKSLDYIKACGVEQISKMQEYLAYSLIEGLLNIKGVSVYGILNSNEGERNGTVLFNIDGMESSRLEEILNRDYKIATRGGWHCAYSAHCALGTEETGGVRASFGAFSKNKDVKGLLSAINRISKKMP